MPMIQHRDSQDPSSHPARTIALIGVAIVLLVALVAFSLHLLHKRRAREPHERSVPNVVFDKLYAIDGADDFIRGPLLPTYVPFDAERPSQDLPSDAPLHSPRSDMALSLLSARSDRREVDDDRAGHAPTRVPPLRLHITIPQIPQTTSASTSKSQMHYHPHAQQQPEPKHQQQQPSALTPSSVTSGSIYSQPSASTTTRLRTQWHTVDLSTPPPLPPLPPRFLFSPPPEAPRPRLPSPPDEPRLRLQLPPEELPLVRGDTVVVAGLLKSRARRSADAPQRSKTRTAQIERVGSITEIPSPLPSESDAEAHAHAQAVSPVRRNHKRGYRIVRSSIAM
ncbi:hypothetical protein GGX14DRAFT_558921 [Mycena pura]|uniref:Uncharacterized protein n=1 Tax=Mycena pura TaxID=153505 RepID=A0AAD6YH79_9AGAR|nr:hypothetical protein GGX14DRAFT_558921 [Mycena pura]